VVIGNDLDWANHEAASATLGCGGNVLADGIHGKAEGVQEVNGQEDLARAQSILQGTTQTAEAPDSVKSHTLNGSQPKQVVHQSLTALKLYMAFCMSAAGIGCLDYAANRFSC
jgi:hypothetical protein